MDKELFKILKRFEKDNFVIVNDGALAREMVKRQRIKKLRYKDELIIGRDRNKKCTIFFKKPKL